MLFEISVKKTIPPTIIILVYYDKSIYNTTQSACVTNMTIVWNLYKIASSVSYSCNDPNNNCMTIMLNYNNS